MDTKEILGYLRSSKYKELYKQQRMLKAFEELDKMIPHFNIDEIPDEEMDEESLRVKKRFKEMLETWRNGGVVELGKKKATGQKEMGNIPKSNKPNVDGKVSGREVPPPQPPEREPTDFEKLKEKWNKGKAKLVLMRLEKKGLITANGNVYDWKIDQEKGYSYRLYVYFVYHASKKLEWMEGNNKERVPWRIFNPMFPNVSGNQSSRNQDLRAIKKGEYPSFAQMIDEVLNW